MGRCRRRARLHCDVHHSTPAPVTNATEHFTAAPRPPMTRRIAVTQKMSGSHTDRVNGLQRPPMLPLLRSIRLLACLLSIARRQIWANKQDNKTVLSVHVRSVAKPQGVLAASVVRQPCSWPRLRSAAPAPSYISAHPLTWPFSIRVTTPGRRGRLGVQSNRDDALSATVSCRNIGGPTR